ncbi:X-ray repair cross-complementing protein 5-like [Belonocnema kinseyi]|uniref:X-ray repair cross-complementing protein 5-like n=1 Tax=Belonocnema kinseyi TaxID=2817044 RepID=UPI00143DCB8D|nr:X-ray repair cross-complementing protein 5-like [Belonocnema kinseyi]
MSKKQKEALVFVVNVGKTSKEKAENETESFLDKSKNIIKQVMERKIFMRPEDIVGVICMGSNKTKNKPGMENIQVLKDDLLVPTWNLVEEVLALEGTEKTSNWVEGLHVALQYMKENCMGRQHIAKIMILNDFQEEEDIMEQFSAGTIKAEVLDSVSSELIIIGKNPLDEAHRKELNLSEKLALHVCNMVDGVYEEIDKYFWETRFYKNPPVNPSAWKCELRIADVKIYTSTYVKVTEPPPFPSWKITTGENSVGYPPDGGNDVKKTRELVDRYRDITDPEEAIKGYKYGGKFIPFSEEDVEVTKFQGTTKSLIVRGFVKQEDVSIEYWFGKGCHVIVASLGSERQFYSLLTAMRDLGLVAIVRKVYCANSIPKMGVLFPRMQPGEPACLVHVSIPFAEERRVLKSKPVKTLAKNLSEEQKQDIEDYIDAFTLPPNEDGEVELFNPGSFCDPCKQYKWDNLSHRALNRVPLPPMDKALLNLISSPESLIQKCKPVVERLKTWVEPKVEKPKEKFEIGHKIEEIDQETQQTEENLIRAAEEAEHEMKRKEDLFKEISEATTAMDEDLLNEM